MTLDLTPTVIRNIVLSAMLFTLTFALTSRVLDRAIEAVFPRPDLDAYCKQYVLPKEKQEER